MTSVDWLFVWTAVNSLFVLGIMTFLLLKNPEGHEHEVEPRVETGDIFELRDEAYRLSRADDKD